MNEITLNKPDRARNRVGSSAENIVQDPARRRFLKLGAGALSVLALLEVGGAGLFYLQPRQTASSFGSVITAGYVAEFPPGSVTEFTDGHFFLVRAADGGFLAIYRRCPHLGCTINWEAGQKQFVCPCHASRFDLYGSFNNAPVPRPLDIFPITIAGDRIQVDTSRLQQRAQFQIEQLAYTHSDGEAN